MLGTIILTGLKHYCVGESVLFGSFCLSWR